MRYVFPKVPLIGQARVMFTQHDSRERKAFTGAGEQQNRCEFLTRVWNSIIDVCVFVRSVSMEGKMNRLWWVCAQSLLVRSPPCVLLLTHEHGSHACRCGRPLLLQVASRWIRDTGGHRTGTALSLYLFVSSHADGSAFFCFLWCRRDSFLVILFVSSRIGRVFLKCRRDMD